MLRHPWVSGLGLLALLLSASACAELEQRKPTADKAPEATAPSGLFYPTALTLKNGVEVIVVPHHRAPVIVHQLWYRTGGADDAPGQAGLAHYLEHLMFKGTAKHPGGAFSRTVSRFGGHDNAFTSYDTTTYTQTIPADKLGVVMAMEADRMSGLKFSLKSGLMERDVVLAERRQRTDDDPAGRLFERMRAVLYGTDDAYGRPVIGSANEIKRFTPAMALKRHKESYAPGNAIVVIAGDITPEEAKRLAEKTYGRVPARPVPPRHRSAEPMVHPMQVAPIKLCDGGLQQASLYRWGRAPAAIDPSSASIEVLAEIISGGRTGRLYRSLVMENKIATGVQASYQGEALAQGMFTISVSPAPGMIDKVESALHDELDRVAQEGVTAEEVAQATGRLTRMGILARDEISNAPQILGLSIATGQSIAHVESWPQRIAAVTPDQVQQAAQALFGRKGGWIGGWLLPQALCASVNATEIPAAQPADSRSGP